MSYLDRFCKKIKKKWQGSLVKARVIRGIEEKAKEYLHSSAKAGLIEKLRRSGVKEVHVRIASPASIRYCPYDPPPRAEEEFIAATHPVEEIRQIIGADTLRYQRLERLPEAVGLPAENLCMDCFRQSKASS